MDILSINGNNYTIKKPDIFSQMELVRLFTPYFKAYVDNKKTLDGIIYIFSMMDEDRYRSIVEKSLSCVFVYNGGSLVKLVNGGTIHQVIELNSTFLLVQKVIDEIVVPFLVGLFARDEEGSPEQTSNGQSLETGRII